MTSSRVTKLVELCAQAGYTLLNVGSREEITGSTALSGIGHIHAFVQGKNDSGYEYPRINGSPAIWDLAEQAGFSPSAGNGHQRQVNDMYFFEKAIFLMIEEVPEMKLMQETIEYIRSYAYQRNSSLQEDKDVFEHIMNHTRLVDLPSLGEVVSYCVHNPMEYSDNWFVYTKGKFHSMMPLSKNYSKERPFYKVPINFQQYDRKNSTELALLTGD